MKMNLQRRGILPQKKLKKKNPNPQKKALAILINYLVLANQRGLLAKIYESGALPYSHREPLDNYLKRNAQLIVEEGGTKELFTIHPDKAVILDMFEQKQCDCQTKEIQENQFSNFSGVNTDLEVVKVSNTSGKTQDNTNNEDIKPNLADNNGREKTIHTFYLTIVVLLLAVGAFLYLKNKNQ